MYVFKFGGASVKSAQEIKNAANIISCYYQTPLMIVVSAMGKMTNAFELLTDYYFYNNRNALYEQFEKIKKFHLEIAENLFENRDFKLLDILDKILHSIENIICEPPGENFNFEYDKIVSKGEELSVTTISYYLNKVNIRNRLFNAKDIIITDASYRDAQIDWDKTNIAVQSKLKPFFNNKTDTEENPIAITQGFIGGTASGYITTLGREGSDYTAAVLANLLNATELYIWKDVPGLLNADPKIIKQTFLIDNISYQEAIELAYYGAKVIHPKTLKPLLSKGIPLKVKSFCQPQDDGTLIDHNKEFDNKIPSYIFKFNQVLLSLSPKDFSFIAEDNLSLIFSEFAKLHVSINLMQNSALNFTVCFDFDKTKTPALIANLKKIFDVNCFYDKELLTIRHYKKADIEPFIKNNRIILEQKTTDTLQLLIDKSL